MLSFAMIALFVAAAALALGVLALQIAATLPQVAPLREALRSCPQTREFRFTFTETLVTPRHGEVVALPIRIKSAAAQPKPYRAAA